MKKIKTMQMKMSISLRTDPKGKQSSTVPSTQHAMSYQSKGKGRTVEASKSQAQTRETKDLPPKKRSNVYVSHYPDWRWSNRTNVEGGDFEASTREIWIVWFADQAIKDIYDVVGCASVSLSGYRGENCIDEIRIKTK